MDQAGIQAKIWSGLGKAAAYLGASYQQYRPASATNPLATPLVSLLADFDVTPTFAYKASAVFAKAVYYGLFDGTNVLPGDYLVGAQRTFYVAGMEPNRPPLCVLCNRTVAFKRPNPNPPGSKFYSGDLRGAGETTLMSGWPASVLQGTRGEKGPVQLPGDTRMPFMAILVPSFPDVTLFANDLMADDLGNVWILSSCEQTDLGWRLTAILADT